jgi:hypothetical protein
MGGGAAFGFPIALGTTRSTTYAASGADLWSARLPPTIHFQKTMFDNSPLGFTIEPAAQALTRGGLRAGNPN